MTTGKKKRMSMLDDLAAAGAPALPSQMGANRALRSARDAVDGHHVWDLDPETIIDDRPADRIDSGDIIELRDAIDANGQTVPILVRRHPTEPEKYLLVYGRRRLEAIRMSGKVKTVRALVANLDDRDAVQAQISENMARRDLTFIEKALFAQELVQSGFGTQAQVAEVLTVTKSSVSMALGVVDLVSPDLIRMIGACPGVGRPRWEALGRAIGPSGLGHDALIRIAEDVHVQAQVDEIKTGAPRPMDIDVQAFEAVEKAVMRRTQVAKAPAPQTRKLTLPGTPGGTLKRTPKGLTVSLDDSAFADWMELHAQTLFTELHARWQQRAEDEPEQ